MAIASIAKSFSNKASKFRLPFCPRPKPKTPTPPPETTNPNGSNGGGAISEPKITKEDKFRQVFRFLDVNDDGKISVEELRAYFTSIGDSVSHEEAAQMIREFSKAAVGGGGGTDPLLLDFEGFVRLMEFEEQDDDVNKILRQAFEVFEVEKGSGCITPEGLRQVLGRLGEVKTCAECEDMIRVFDLDGNGFLDFHEFRKMMT